MTLKSIKNTKAIDISKYSLEDCKKIFAGSWYSVIGTSHGVYGINGAILQDGITGELYKITSRNSVLFYFV